VSKLAKKPFGRLQVYGRKKRGSAIFYHRTTEASARKILRGGFRDGTGTYGFTRTLRGVWLSNVPLDCNEGAWGDVLLQVDLPEQVVANYEWIEEGKPYREWLVPARLINKQAKISVVKEDEAEEVSLHRLIEALKAFDTPGAEKD
jgi:hypothetical protein